ncbi:Uncharacterised protein [Corynebacterium kutscheri]|uniref:Uncharacterized protein n=1 Tax=Corynebacterium kutscheri TaxID=35755 RepID=A0A0F6TDV3_9CORY|nr:hypothetical protein [Corynebacterium kutscheri]AKE41979.1 hypothetical protein UL82_09195 [Corynebacterium kutscheri]VEH06232.1 Uncharacterised protein [Corynebacterium kutscheri]VEH10320.1 Uncharacterised protein [Corynebacterium kutscheri]VEH82148.1 Uncharacterised protein [Corynebacterium kutscheri]
MKQLVTLMLSCIALSACGIDTPDPLPSVNPSAYPSLTDTTMNHHSQALPPVFATLEELITAEEITIPMNSSLVVLLGEGESPTQWTGTVADESVATVFPGGTIGSAEFNLGFVPVSPGTTQVSLTGPTGQSTNLLLEVVAQQN